MITNEYKTQDAIIFQKNPYQIATTKKKKHRHKLQISTVPGYT